MQHVARQLNVTYPANIHLSQVASIFWHSPPEKVFTVLSALQATLDKQPASRPAIWIGIGFGGRDRDRWWFRWSALEL